MTLFGYGHLVIEANSIPAKPSRNQDVDIGGDSTFIMCIQSGHVYVRPRKSKGSAAVGGKKSFRFQRVPHIQRIIGVCTNSTGTFGALRVDYEPSPVHVGTTLGTDMAAITPYMCDDAKEKLRSKHFTCAGLLDGG